MKKQSEQIFECITNIEDEFVDEALEERQSLKRLNLKPLLAAAACLALFAVGSAAISQTRTPKTENYQSYEGPVLPLTLREKDSDIEAVRNTDFDFASYHSPENVQPFSTVTDQYQITNNNTSAKTVEFLYPFTGSYAKLSELLPLIQKDGESVSAELLAGNYTGDFLSDSLDDAESDAESYNLKSPENWKAYKELLEDGTYVENLFAPLKSLDMPVTVYRFDEETSGTSDHTDLVVDVTFHPEKTQILSYGFNGADFDDENNSRTYRASIPQEASQILIVIGEDLDSFEISKKDNKTGKSGLADRENVSRETVTLTSILTEIEKEYMQILTNGYGIKAEHYTEEMYDRSVAQMLTEYGVLSSREIIRYSGAVLEDILSDVFQQKRVFYLKFTLELQPSSETEIAITLQKPYSHNFSCSSKDESHGYDLITRAGSNLTFTEQNASLTNTETITIPDQNFGFTPDQNTKSIPLDLTKEHYYLKIRQ